jgi:hypothetical protein
MDKQLIQGSPKRRRLNQIGRRLCALVDETLYGDQLAVSRAHQAAIDEIASKPVPYTLTPLAEALLSESPETAGP